MSASTVSGIGFRLESDLISFDAEAADEVAALRCTLAVSPPRTRGAGSVSPRAPGVCRSPPRRHTPPSTPHAAPLRHPRPPVVPATRGADSKWTAGSRQPPRRTPSRCRTTDRQTSAAPELPRQSDDESRLASRTNEAAPLEHQGTNVDAAHLPAVTPNAVSDHRVPSSLSSSATASTGTSCTEGQTGGTCRFGVALPLAVGASRGVSSTAQPARFSVPQGVSIAEFARNQRAILEGPQRPSWSTNDDYDLYYSGNYLAPGRSANTAPPRSAAHRGDEDAFRRQWRHQKQPVAASGTMDRAESHVQSDTSAAASRDSSRGTSVSSVLPPSDNDTGQREHTLGAISIRERTHRLTDVTAPLDELGSGAGQQEEVYLQDSPLMEPYAVYSPSLQPAFGFRAAPDSQRHVARSDGGVPPAAVTTLDRAAHRPVVGSDHTARDLFPSATAPRLLSGRSASAEATSAGVRSQSRSSNGGGEGHGCGALSGSPCVTGASRPNHDVDADDRAGYRSHEVERPMVLLIVVRTPLTGAAAGGRWRDHGDAGGGCCPERSDREGPLVVRMFVPPVLLRDTCVLDVKREIERQLDVAADRQMLRCNGMLLRDAVPLARLASAEPLFLEFANTEPAPASVATPRAALGASAALGAPAQELCGPGTVVRELLEGLTRGRAGAVRGEGAHGPPGQWTARVAQDAGPLGTFYTVTQAERDALRQRLSTLERLRGPEALDATNGSRPSSPTDPTRRSCDFSRSSSSSSRRGFSSSGSSVHPSRCHTRRGDESSSWSARCSSSDGRGTPELRLGGDRLGGPRAPRRDVPARAAPPRPPPDRVEQPQLPHPAPLPATDDVALPYAEQEHLLDDVMERVTEQMQLLHWMRQRLGRRTPPAPLDTASRADLAGRPREVAGRFASVAPSPATDRTDGDDASGVFAANWKLNAPPPRPLPPAASAAVPVRPAPPLPAAAASPPPRLLAQMEDA